MRVEWPRNSGRIAEYDDDELEQMRELLHSGRKGAHLEVELLHTFKVEFPGSHLKRSPSSGRVDRVTVPFPADTAG